MHRTHIAAFAVATFASGGLNIACLGPTGTAHAETLCSPSNANTAPCAPPEGPPGDVRRVRQLRPALVPWFGNERHTGLGQERLPHLLHRPQRSLD